MRAKEQRRPGRERRFVVAQVDAIGRADFAQHGTAALEHFGQAKTAADFDELPARDDDLPAFRKRIENQQHGRRAVVDDQRRFGARQLADQAGDVVVARAAPSFG